MKQNTTAIFNKAIKLLLIAGGFFLILSIVSNTFDSDFGWHLRFGKDALSNNFQYTDSYTYSYFGKQWVNHEWGGDILFWLMYDKLGYFSLVILVSAVLWAAFLLTIKIINAELASSGILIAFIMFLGSKFIVMMRLSMFAPLFFVLLWLTLEKLQYKKTYFWWPIILWAWSFFHGSWVLGFITINIYLGGNIIQRIIAKKWPNSFFDTKQKSWNNKTIFNAIVWQIIAGLAVMINPYGWKIWHEVVLYFTNNFYKSYINEWLPSYGFPVYWGPLFISALAIVIIGAGWQKKKISWPRILLFAAFFISAWQYKRNNLFLLLICVPLVVASWLEWADNIKINKKIGAIIICLAFLLYGIFYTPKLRVNQNIWLDENLLVRYSSPVEAVKFLKEKIGANNNTRIFNNYGWGGYMNWVLPNSLVYIDGRSAATWQADNGDSLLKEYIITMTKPDMVDELEKQNVKFVLLQKNNSYFPTPNWINKMIFKKEDIAMAMSAPETQLEKDLKKNKKWRIIYSDYMSVIWEKI